MKTVDVDSDEVEAARASCRGWCPDCEDFTTDEVDDDAVGQRCNQIFEHKRVLGVHAAILGEYIVPVLP